MKRKPTRVELEEAHSDLEKRTKEAKVVLEQKEIALRHARESLAEVGQDLRLHENNMKFMRSKADVVDIKEYSGVQKLLESAESEHETVQIKVSRLLGDIEHINRVLARAEGELRKLNETLDACGQVIPFTFRRAP